MTVQVRHIRLELAREPEHPRSDARTYFVDRVMDV